MSESANRPVPTELQPAAAATGLALPSDASRLHASTAQMLSRLARAAALAPSPEPVPDAATQADGTTDLPQATVCDSQECPPADDARGVRELAQVSDASTAGAAMPGDSNATPATPAAATGAPGLWPLGMLVAGSAGVSAVGATHLPAILPATVAPPAPAPAPAAPAPSGDSSDAGSPAAPAPAPAPATPATFNGGYVIDGPVRNAVVFRDSDGDGKWLDVNQNGQWDAGDEFVVHTDGEGKFADLGGTGRVVATTLQGLVSASSTGVAGHVFSVAETLTDSTGYGITGHAIDTDTGLPFSGYFVSNSTPVQTLAGDDAIQNHVYVTSLSTLTSALLEHRGITDPTVEDIVRAANDVHRMLPSDFDQPEITDATQAIAFFTSSANEQINALMTSLAELRTPLDGYGSETVVSMLDLMVQAIDEAIAAAAEPDAGELARFDLCDPLWLAGFFGLDQRESSALVQSIANEGTGRATGLSMIVSSMLTGAASSSVAAPDAPYAQVFVLAPGSSHTATLNLGDIEAPAGQLSGAVIVQEATGDYASSDMTMYLQGGTVSSIDISAGRELARASGFISSAEGLSLDGHIAVLAQGVASFTELSAPAVIDFAAGSAIAVQAQAIAATSVAGLLAAGDATLDLRAVADASVASVSLQAADTGFNLSGLTVQAGATGASASFDMGGSAVTVSGGVELLADGLASRAAVLLDNISTLGGVLSVHALGDYADGSVVASASNGTLGAIDVAAGGVGAIAQFGAQGAFELSGALDVQALGEGSFAQADLSGAALWMDGSRLSVLAAPEYSTANLAIGSGSGSIARLDVEADQCATTTAGIGFDGQLNGDVYVLANGPGATASLDLHANASGIELASGTAIAVQAVTRADATWQEAGDALLPVALAGASIQGLQGVLDTLSVSAFGVGEAGALAQVGFLAGGASTINLLAEDSLAQVALWLNQDLAGSVVNVQGNGRAVLRSDGTGPATIDLTYLHAWGTGSFGLEIGGADRDLGSIDVDTMIAASTRIDGFSAAMDSLSFVDASAAFGLGGTQEQGALWLASATSDAQDLSAFIDQASAAWTLDAGWSSQLYVGTVNGDLWLAWDRDGDGVSGLIQLNADAPVDVTRFAPRQWIDLSGQQGEVTDDWTRQVSSVAQLDYDDDGHHAMQATVRTAHTLLQDLNVRSDQSGAIQLDLAAADDGQLTLRQSSLHVEAFGADGSASLVLGHSDGTIADLVMHAEGISSDVHASLDGFSGSIGTLDLFAGSRCTVNLDAQHLRQDVGQLNLRLYDADGHATLSFDDGVVLRTDIDTSNSMPFIAHHAVLDFNLSRQGGEVYVHATQGATVDVSLTYGDCTADAIYLGHRDEQGLFVAEPDARMALTINATERSTDWSDPTLTDNVLRIWGFDLTKDSISFGTDWTGRTAQEWRPVDSMEVFMQTADQVLDGNMQYYFGRVSDGNGQVTSYLAYDGDGEGITRVVSLQDTQDLYLMAASGQTYNDIQ